MSRRASWVISGCLLAACENGQAGDAAPEASMRPAAAAVVLAGRPILARLPPRLAALAEPALRLVPSPAAAGELPTGTSKIGGVPELPPGTSWPLAADGRPLAFLAQIQLAEVERHLPGSELPNQGLLSFFYDAAEQPEGYRPSDRRGFAVIHSGLAAERLRRLPVPSALVPPPFAPRKLTFAGARSYPDPITYNVTRLGLEGGELADYRDVLDLLGASRPAPDHQLLGHAVDVDGDVQAECQLVSNGIDISEGFDAETDPRWRVLEQGSADWRLLLQLDSDPTNGMSWGEGGKLHFFVRKQDARAGRFDAVWLILTTG